jgi:uncharacterized membrane protein YbhN (UPF0104 family)
MFLNYVTVYFCFEFLKLSNTNLKNVDFLSCFNIINAASTAARFIPTPGGEGTTELMVINLLQVDKFNCFS